MTWTTALERLVAARRPRPTKSVRPALESLEDRCVPAVLHVGVTEQYTTLAAAAAVAQNGDDVQIDAGTYAGQGNIGITWSQSNLTIEGVGGTAHFDATNFSISNRKGIFVIDGSNTTVRNIEFSGAHDSAGLDKNWAGIRQEGATLTVDHCYFHNNDDGMLVNAGATSDILVEYSQFAQNGYGDGYSHNMYIGNVRTFTLEYSYVHDAIVGHDVKSRANTNYILYNWIGDTGIGSASFELSMPNGGTAYVIGNVIRQDPDTQNHLIIDWGSEGAINPTQGVYFVNNTIINDYSAGTYISVNGSGMPVEILNNIFGGVGAGSSTIYSGPAATQTGNLTAGNPGFANPGAFDYHLTAGSAAINAGANPSSANGFSLTPTNEYLAVANTQARPADGTLDIGAYEFSNPVTVPATPANLTAAAGNGQVGLSWSASAGATSYNVYRWNGSSYVLVKNVGGTSYTDTGLSNGTTYWYEVTAVNTAGESGASNQVSATPQAPVSVPAAPSNLAATAENGQVGLSWSASTGATSCNIYRWNGSSYAFLKNVSGTSYTDAGLSNGTTYYYEVTALNSAGESGVSNAVSATPKASVTLPAAPSNLSARTASASQLNLTWKDNSTNETGFVIDWATNSSFTAGLVSVTVGANVTSYHATGLAAGTKYYFRIRAINTAGSSANTSTASAVTLPAAPTGLSATAGNALVTLKWTASAGATSYDIYRSTSSGTEKLYKTGVTTTSFTDIGLTNGTTYYYKITAVDAGGQSVKSSQVYAKPHA